MVNYLVPLDGSDNAKAAFYTAVMMMKKEKDTLYLMAVVDDLRVYGFHVHGIPASVYDEAQEKAKKEAGKLLHRYGRMCDAQKIPHSLLIGVSNHVGEMICQATQKKHIDFLVIGRRGMGKLKRLFVGSTSRYCVENCDCNVLVVKGDWGPQEEHSDIKEIVRMEEEERHRREEEQDKMMEEAKHKMEQLNIDYQLKPKE